MKKALVTMVFGEEYRQLAELTHPSMKIYAEAIGADFVVIDQPKIGYKYVQYEKLQLLDILTKYPRVIYMDTDLIVRPDCPDLFEIVPEHLLGAFNEGRFTDALEIMKDACAKYKLAIPKWDHQYYNTGVLVLSRLHRHIFKPVAECFDKYMFGGKEVGFYYEQPLLNIRIISESYKIKDLPHRFNRLSYMDKFTGEPRLRSYIVHYAGLKDPAIRIELIKKDLAQWTKDAPDYRYPRNIHVNVGGGLGDQVDTEPVIRYMCEKAYKGDNIRVRTDFKEIFKHLPVRLFSQEEMRQELQRDQTVYYQMESLPSPQSPMWQYISHPMCHTVDFASMACLRKILPDVDKQIKLEIDPMDVEAVKKTIGVEDLTELILIHPGKGWQSKTFPKEYWQGIIDGLKDFPIAIIGKYVSTDQGLVDIKIPEGCLDLRNMLDLRELLALTSEVRMVISNDSSPVHIAGAFDPWIILLPSCKHPDHILPYRHGKKTYKTLALYKKLTCDAIDSTPTQVDGQTIDWINGDIMDYLLPADKVAAQCARVYQLKEGVCELVKCS